MTELTEFAELRLYQYVVYPLGEDSNEYSPDSDTVSLIEAMPAGAVVTLDGVTWDDSPRARLAYDHGRLEIMSPSLKHEGIARLFPHLLMALAEGCRLNFRSFGSVTMYNRKKQRGLEPDDCFYFHSALKTSRRKHFDASVDPPPELAIEVDVISSSINKFPIFAATGTAELWRYEREKVRFYCLVGREYTEIPQSNLFPFLTAADVSKFHRKGEIDGGVPMLKAFRRWIQLRRQSRGRRRKSGESR